MRVSRSRPSSAPGLLRSLALAAFVPALLPGCGESDGEARQGPPSDEAAPEQAQEAVDLRGVGYDDGDMDEAAVWVVEFSDFGCIYCARFHVEDYPLLHGEFVEPGDVAWKYVPVTIGGFPNAEEATAAGICAGDQGEFAPMRDHLFEHREEWMGSEDPDGLLREYAAGLDLDLDAFDACYASDEPRERLQEMNELARRAGVSATPWFVVQGFPVRGLPPRDAFQEVLRDLIAEARAGDGG